MESKNSMEAAPSCNDRMLPQIGINHQVTMPPLKQSARIASLEYINRDQWYAWGLAVPVMRIAAPSPLLRKYKSLADEEKSLSLASTSNSGNHALQPTGQHQQFSCSKAAASKAANSCASSSKETCLAWREESFAITIINTFEASQLDGKDAMAEDVPGASGQSELKSSITSAVQGSSVIRKKKKRRSCWQTLRRRGNKKARTEKGKKEKRWSGSLHTEVEASGEGYARAPERCEILPGGQPDSWSEEEVAAFTLALYLFDKDFCAIKRFLETKKIKDIVHHYYGKFYGTPAFCRWAGSKNNRNRKCVHGPRILEGWRQDELLRRLLPNVPVNYKDEIPEAVKAFNERELTVEAFVSELKAAVGLEVLVRCVGIGVPKRDLTAVHADPAKIGNQSSVRGDLPLGKACSSLSKEEMLEYLNGAFRISKTRAQDLFWEAIWPRLVDHGWHSMRCEMPGLPESKNPLTFLRPGVKKISKGSSERGVHYFGSVSEVLKAVAKDPSLLDGPELTEDTFEEGSDNQEDEDVQEWSDDMFETLDMHRFRVPRSRKAETRVKNERVDLKPDQHTAQDSSGSSSVDIDLNRPLSATSSKNPERLGDEKDMEPHSSAFNHTSDNNHTKFVKEEIDLNLPPIDLDCHTSPVSVTGGDDELKNYNLNAVAKLSSGISALGETEILDLKTCDACPVVMHSLISASAEPDTTSVIGTINLNDPLPTTGMMIAGDCELGTRDQEQNQAIVEFVEIPRVLPVGMELVTFNTSPDIYLLDRPQLLAKGSSCSCGLSILCKCQSRKRSLSDEESTSAVEGVDKEIDFISLPKKRAIRLRIPLSLGDLCTSNFVLTMGDIPRCPWSKLGLQPFNSWRGDWIIRVPPSLVPFDVEQKLTVNRELELPKCKIVEVDGEMEVVDDVEQCGNERGVPSSLRLSKCNVVKLDSDVEGAEDYVYRGNEGVISKLRQPSKCKVVDIDDNMEAVDDVDHHGNGREVPSSLRLSNCKVDEIAGDLEAVGDVEYHGNEQDMSTASQLLECNVVETGGDRGPVEVVENHGNDADLPRSLSTGMPLPGPYGHVKRLKCHFSDKEAPVSSSYSRSAAQRLPRKLTISFESRSSKNRLLQAKQRCSTWSWPQVGADKLSVAKGLNTCLTSRGAPARDFTVNERVLEECQQAGGVDVEVFGDGENHTQSEDSVLQMKLGCSRKPWESQSEAVNIGEDVRDEMDATKPLLRDWEVPCLNVTSPGDCCDSYNLPRQMAYSRGMRSSGRSHSLTLPVMAINDDYLDFHTGMKRRGADFHRIENSKKVKIDPAPLPGSRDIAENNNLLMTLCSMHEQKLENTATSSEGPPKVRGKRSSRVRRSNFSFKQFIFEGHMEEVDEGSCVQRCTSQGPWQPTCHLPTIDKVARSPKLRRRRSGLPCRSSCITGANCSVLPVLKGSSSLKGQMGSRCPAQSATAEEEATAPLNWPLHDVRFSLRRALSDGSIKTDRQSGRKVPARWNLFPVC